MAPGRRYGRRARGGPSTSAIHTACNQPAAPPGTSPAGAGRTPTSRARPDGAGTCDGAPTGFRPGFGARAWPGPLDAPARPCWTACAGVGFLAGGVSAGSRRSPPVAGGLGSGWRRGWCLPSPSHTNTITAHSSSSKSPSSRPHLPTARRAARGPAGPHAVRARPPPGSGAYLPIPEPSSPTRPAPPEAPPDAPGPPMGSLATPGPCPSPRRAMACRIAVSARIFCRV